MDIFSSSSWEILGDQSQPLSIFDAIAVSFYVNRGAMMQNPIENSRRDNVILEDISPFAIGFIGSENDRSFLVSPGDQLEETVRSQLVKRQITDLIYDQKLKLR